MALTKVNYIDNETAITADQMNAIQDEIIANSKAREYGYGAALPTVAGSTDEEFLANIEALCAEKIKMATFQAILYPPGEAFDGNSFIAQIWNNITESNDNKFIKIKAHGVTTTLEFQRVCYANEWFEPVLNLDAIIEQGTSGIWTYRKWASGIAECWCRHSIDATPSNTLNGVYYSPSITVIFPFEFAAVPTISVGGGSTGVVNWAREFASTEKQVSYIVCANQNTGSKNVAINIHAIGRWK